MRCYYLDVRGDSEALAGVVQNGSNDARNAQRHAPGGTLLQADHFLGAAKACNGIASHIVNYHRTEKQTRLAQGLHLIKTSIVSISSAACPLLRVYW